MATECSECRKNFPQKPDKHMLSHTWEKPFACVECGKAFPHRLMLKKHMFTHAGEKPFKCNRCGDQFIVRQNFETHKLIHSEEKQLCSDERGNNLFKQELEEQEFDAGDETLQSIWLVPCSENTDVKCSESCETSQAVKFLQVDPNEKTDAVYQCSSCGNIYSTNKSLKRHLKTCGSVGSLNKTKCLHPSCEKRFFHVTKMIHHLENDHSGMRVNAEEVNFVSLAEFTKWKEEEELKTFSYFSRSSGKTCLKGGVYTYYTCQHDGSERFHCRTGEAGRTTSRKWVKGRVKTGITCPSRMLVKEFNDGTVSVKYISTHNHEVKFENTKYQPLPPSTLNLVKQLLALGVTPRKIQEKLLNGISDSCSENSPSQLPKKEYFVSLKQLNELKRKLKINSKVDEADAECVASLVKKLEGSPTSPVVTYKPQGGPVAIGDSNLDNLPYAKELFAVGLQTEQQIKIMGEGITRLLCIDFFHFDNEHDFFLVSLIVPDDLGSCYPVAHFITNHKDERTLSCLFSSLKKQWSNLRVKALMTDEEGRGVCALKTIFGHMRTLWCQGHVRKNWLSKLQATMNDKELRLEMMLKLDALLYEKSEECFQNFCESFMRKYGKLCPDFTDYFSKCYLKNPEIWADCYRMFPHSNIDTTKYYIPFHNKLQTYCSSEKYVGKISDLLVFLLEIDKENFRQYEEKMKYRRPSAFGDLLLNVKHARGLQILDSDITVSEGVWKVASQHNKNIVYIIRCISEECQQDLCVEKCSALSCAGLCAHLFLCSCYDMSGLCKHIHKIRSVSMQQLGKAREIYSEGAQEVFCELKQELYIEQGREMCHEESQKEYSEQTPMLCGHTQNVYTMQMQDVYTTKAHGVYYSRIETEEVQDCEAVTLQEIQNCEAEEIQNCEVEEMQICEAEEIQDCEAAEIQDAEAVETQDAEAIEVLDSKHTQVVNVCSAKVERVHSGDVRDVYCSSGQATHVLCAQDSVCITHHVSKFDVELYPLAPHAEIVVSSEYVAPHSEALMPAHNADVSQLTAGVECKVAVSHIERFAGCEDILAQVESH